MVHGFRAFRGPLPSEYNPNLIQHTAYHLYIVPVYKHHTIKTVHRGSLLRGLYRNITGSTLISLGIILLLRTMLIRNLSGPYSWTVFLLLLSLIILKSTILVLTWFNWFCWFANRLDCWVTCEFTGWNPEKYTCIEYSHF